MPPPTSPQTIVIPNSQYHECLAFGQKLFNVMLVLQKQGFEQVVVQPTGTLCEQAKHNNVNAQQNVDVYSSRRATTCPLGDPYLAAGYLQPNEEQKLGMVVPGEPVEPVIKEAFDNGGEAVDGPVCELCRVGTVGLDRLEAIVHWIQDAHDVAVCRGGWGESVWKRKPTIVCHRIDAPLQPPTMQHEQPPQRVERCQSAAPAAPPVACRGENRGSIAVFVERQLRNAVFPTAAAGVPKGLDINSNGCVKRLLLR